MKKGIKMAAAVSLTFMTLHIPLFASAAEKRDFKPASGGYTITMPPGSEEIYHTSTGVRFKVGEDFMVSADLYTLPSFISVPMKQYSSEQKREFNRFLSKIQDDPQNTIENDLTGSQESKENKDSQDKVQMLRDKLRRSRASAQNQNVSATGMQSGSYEFRAVPKDPDRTKRPYIIGKAYQPQKNELCVVTVRATEGSAEAGKQALKALTDNLDLSRVRYTDSNMLIVPPLEFKMEIPSGWRMYTLRADNVIFGRSLSSVHTDSMMIRRISDDSFRELGSATKDNLKEAETNFINKITEYTPNVTILRHEPVMVGDLRGSLTESTDNEDLKKVFILNAYLLNPEGKGYIIHFQTDDTINYDLKLNAFKRSVESFTIIPGENKK